VLLGLIAALAAAYLIGSLPTGYAIARLRGVNVLRVGSGHTGATNVLRSSGLACAALTAVADIAKGYAGVAVARIVAPGALWAPALAGIATVLGHNKSIFLRFGGGVGTMTTLGATLAISPIAALIALVAGAIPMALTRYASVGSLIFAIAVPIIMGFGALLRGWPIAWVLFGVGTALLSIWELRRNIQRLARGQERKIGQTIAPGSDDVSSE